MPDECRSLVATFGVDSAALKRLVPLLTATPEEAWVRLTHDVLAVEVIEFPAADAAQPKSFAVLLSTGNSPDAPTELQCWLAFCNDVARCDRFRDAGVPMIEAEMRLDGSTLEVVANHYRPDQLAQSWSRLVRFYGLTFALPRGARPAKSEVVYQQIQPRPDLMRPGFDLVGRRCRWLSQRSVSTKEPDSVAVCFEPALFPDFNPLFTGPAGARHVPHAVFRTTFADTDPVESGAQSPHEPPLRLRRPGTVGLPDYRFEDMEILGFRVELPADAGIGSELDALVAPLNFHLHDKVAARRGNVDFEYRAATRTLVVELIRYGRMKYASDNGPLMADTFMSQHELLVRLLVGRVDEDAAQAREAATFVQSIFVDNPTSKAVGRDMQGYPKLLGAFCHDDGSSLQALQQDGTLHGRPVPLHQIHALCRLHTLPGRQLEKHKLLEFAYSDPAFSEGGFVNVNEGLFSSLSRVVVLPWEQDDFDDPAFRRSFARSVVAQGLQRSRSVQVVPVEAAKDEYRTWLTGTFALGRLRFQQPSGIASLTFHPDHGGPGWQALCKLLNLPGASNAPVSINLPSGAWYRVRCNMDLKIDDGLAWS